MNLHLTLRSFDEKLTSSISKLKIKYNYALVIGRITSPAFWATYLLGVHVLWLTPGLLFGDILLVIAALPLASLVKVFIRRNRPATLYVNNMKIKSYSFPSSHSYSSALACGYFTILSIENGAIQFAPIFMAITFAVGLSRVIVGAHYPSDVLAGWLLGFIILAGISL